MKNLNLRPLQAEDAAQLLQFEQCNRVWFEHHIDARPANFYSLPGVRSHIAQLLELTTQGLFHPNVLLDENGVILGRANLKDIQQESGIAEVGYRIGQQYVGQGLATLALAYLTQVAYSQCGLKRLIALVTQENLASARVLEKSGFMQDEHVQNLAMVAGQMRDGYQFSLDLYR
jgi:ribosomal-protein-alanine N-acetyltransferase